MRKKRGPIILLSCCAIVIGAALLAYFFISDGQRKQAELEERQLVSEVMQYINNVYDNFTESAGDRANQISLYYGLSDYNNEYRRSGLRSEEVDALFDLVLSNMLTDFAIAYNDIMIDAASAAAETIHKKQEYVFNTRESIDDINTRFITVDVSAGGADNPGADGGMEEKARLYFELAGMLDEFIASDYLGGFADEINGHIESMGGIRELINTEGVLAEAEQSKVLFGEISRLEESYLRELESNDRDNLLQKFENTLGSMKMGFTNYYGSIFDEISDRPRANSADTDTIEDQIKDLLALRDTISSGGVFDENWYMFEDIDDLVEKYEKEFEDISGRKAQEEKEQSGGASVGGGNPNIGDSTGASTNAPSNIQTLAAEILRLTNIERANYDLPPLSGDNGLLNSSAIVRAIETITSFSHTRPDGRSCFTVYTDAGGQYSYLGENIAYGYTTPEATVQAWMESPGHRENILRADFTQLGVGVVQDSNNTTYWAQMFCG